MSFYKHETAIVEGTDIGEGTRIWHFAHVRATAKIGKGCNIGKSVYIDSDAVIGDRVKIQNFVSVYKGLTIEDDVFVGPAATFTNDLYPRAEHWSDDDLVSTIVRKGASIGANSTIICGVEIGTYAMIGAGSVWPRGWKPGETHWTCVFLWEKTRERR
jgi:UDP-2-acetamido-3-amino-2,3-dideoxy-glucuronate N-acetyltransferase